MDVVPFVREGLGNSSYLFGIGGGRAVLVDPDRVVGRYLSAAEARDWEITAVLETHLHADFVTGSLEVSRATGATIFQSAEAGVGFPHRGLSPGDRFELGDFEVEAVASPGHTPEHLAYVVRDGSGPPALFSGGALIAGGAARTDLVAPDLTDGLTRAQFHTLRGAFADLPDETLLLPTHGGGSFCSVSFGERRTSALGEERRTNPLLDHDDEEEFVRWFPTTFPAIPAYFSRMRSVNGAGPRLRASIEDPRPMAADEFDRAREEGLVVDVRPSRAYAAGHVPGSLLVSFRDSYATWLGWLAPPEAPLLFVADGVPIGEVVDESLLVGYERFTGYLDGGFEAWEAAGKPVARATLAGPAAAALALEDGAVAVDVREADEFALGHVPGALHVPLGKLADRLGELPAGRPIVTYCAGRDRSSTGISILERAGIGPLLSLDGGFDAWREGGRRWTT